MSKMTDFHAMRNRPAVAADRAAEVREWLRQLSDPSERDEVLRQVFDVDQVNA